MEATRAWRVHQWLAARRSSMTRVALLSSEPIRALHGGDRHPLSRVRAAAAAPRGRGGPGLARGAGGDGGARRARRSRDPPLRARPAGARCSRTATPPWPRGSSPTTSSSRCPDLPVAIDLYDPWLIENFAYFETLGLDPYRNDHATWVLQMSRGDFFLCSSEEQRTFYLGFLAALGRVNPERIAGGPGPRDAHRARALRRAGRAAASSAGAAAARGRRAAAPLRRPLRLVRPLDAARRPGAPRPARLDPAAHPQPQPGEHAAAPVRRGRGALPLARLVGEPRPGPSTGCRPSGATTCCATSTSSSPPTGRAWRRASRCAPASSTPSRPAARW